MSLSKWVFAEFYDLLNAVVESKVVPYREMTAGQCRGRVLEIGGGTGANLKYLDRCVSIDATEPDPHMRKKFSANAIKIGTNASLTSYYGEDLGYLDCTFDSVFTTLVLCMVDDVEQVIDEAYRVLKPGGVFYFYEHVISTKRFGHTFQTILDPCWQFFTTGCHLKRDLKRALMKSNFEKVKIWDFDLEINTLIKIPNIVGSARKL